MFESAGGDAGLWLSRLFGGGGGMPVAANAVPSVDYGAALGAMNPGMAGFGAVPNEAFNASQPFTSGNTALGEVSNKELSDALGKLGGAGATGKGAGAGDRPPMPGQGPSGGTGRFTSQSLSPLLQLLNARRDALLQSATGGVGAGAPQGAKPTAGLLGF